MDIQTSYFGMDNFVEILALQELLDRISMAWKLAAGQPMDPSEPFDGSEPHLVRMGIQIYSADHSVAIKAICIFWYSTDFCQDLKTSKQNNNNGETIKLNSLSQT